MDSFTDTLLPTDRWPWSDVTGVNPQPLHSFQLPSLSWEWEGDWYVDQSCGEPSQAGVRLDFSPPRLCPLPLPQSQCVRCSPGLGVRRGLPGQLLARQEVELLRSPQTLDPLPEICGARLLGKGASRRHRILF